jgi:hypothetical protein
VQSYQIGRIISFGQFFKLQKYPKILGYFFNGPFFKASSPQKKNAHFGGLLAGPGGSQHERRPVGPLDGVDLAASLQQVVDGLGPRKLGSISMKPFRPKFTDKT